MCCRRKNSVCSIFNTTFFFFFYIKKPIHTDHSHKAKQHNILQIKARIQNIVSNDEKYSFQVNVHWGTEHPGPGIGVDHPKCQYPDEDNWKSINPVILCYCVSWVRITWSKGPGSPFIFWFQDIEQYQSIEKMEKKRCPETRRDRYRKEKVGGIGRGLRGGLEIQEHGTSPLSLSCCLSYQLVWGNFYVQAVNC